MIPYSYAGLGSVRFGSVRGQVSVSGIEKSRIERSEGNEWVQFMKEGDGREMERKKTHLFVWVGEWVQASSGSLRRAGVCLFLSSLKDR